MSKKNIKIYQLHEILKGANTTSRVLWYSRIFHLIMQLQEAPSSQEKKETENDWNYLGNSPQNSNLIKFV